MNFIDMFCQAGGVFTLQPEETTPSAVIAKDSVSFTLKFKEGRIVFDFTRVSRFMHQKCLLKENL